jgi:ABC-type multidrug transport system ATPase subunit
LRALAGALGGVKTLRTEGTIEYNGQPGNALAAPRFAAYVGQHDEHAPSLTVEQTLLFARQCSLKDGFLVRARVWRRRGRAREERPSVFGFKNLCKRPNKHPSLPPKKTNTRPKNRS